MDEDQLPETKTVVNINDKWTILQRELSIESWCATLVGSRALELYYRKACVIVEYRYPWLVRVHFFGVTWDDDVWLDITKSEWVKQHLEYNADLHTTILSEQLGPVGNPYETLAEQRDRERKERRKREKQFNNEFNSGYQPWRTPDDALGTPGDGLLLNKISGSTAGGGAIPGLLGL